MAKRKCARCGKPVEDYIKDGGKIICFDCMKKSTNPDDREVAGYIDRLTRVAGVKNKK
jgi:hypothetical protein